MTVRIRRSDARGHFDHGWLDTRHTFSFAGYHDPEHMGFRVLRVINEDRVLPGEGFGTHPHRDMEIITCVVSGGLEHRDSMGNGSVIRPGDVQRMTAGTGLTHSEFNASSAEPVHFLQIWILPAVRGTKPSWKQVHFPDAERTNKLRILVSPDGRDGSLTVGQDAVLFGSLLDPGRFVALPLATGRHAWVQIISGKVLAGEYELSPGDGLAASDLSELRLSAVERSELIVLDLP